MRKHFLKFKINESEIETDIFKYKFEWEGINRNKINQESKNTKD